MATTAAESFEKSHRLRRKEEFDFVFSQPELRLRRPGVLLMLARRNQLGGARLGIVATRRAIPQAAARNRAKRRLRESFRRRRHQLPALDIVVLAHAQLAAKDPAAATRALAAVWTELSTRASPNA